MPSKSVCAPRVLAIFDGPSRSVSCTIELRHTLAERDPPIRAGLHTGEIEVAHDGDIGGIAVHIAARVMAEAEADDIIVSNTVKELIVGSGTLLEPIGARHLKGVPDRWNLFRVTLREST